MSRLTVNAAIDRVLAPEGFERLNRDTWRRKQPGFVDEIDIQIASSFDKLTVNIAMVDEVNRELMSSHNGLQVHINHDVNERLGILLTGRDKWWARSDPGAPAELSEGLMTHGLPFLARMRTLTGFKEFLIKDIGAGRWGTTASRLNLAVVLWRLGDPVAGAKLLEGPPPRFLGEKFRAEIDDFRRWLQSKGAEAQPAHGQGDPP